MSAIPTVNGAAIAVANITELAAVDATGLTLGTRAYIVADKTVYLLQISTASIGAGVVAVLGVTGARWLIDSSAAGALWTVIAGAALLNQTANVGSSPLAISADLVETVSAHPSRIGTDIRRTVIDARSAGGTNNAGQTVVGLNFAFNKDGSNISIYADAGDAVGPSNAGTWARIIPVLIQTNNPVAFKASGSPAGITRFTAILIPNMGIFTDGGGTAIHIGRAATMTLEGAPDTSDPNIIFDAKSALWIQNDPLTVGDAIEWGQNGGNSSYEDITGSGLANAPAAGHMRRIYDPVVQGYAVAIDAESTYRPLPVAFNIYRQFDPSARTYPNGDTVVATYTPASATRKGFSGFLPRRFNLPADITISGGHLFPWIRFTFNNGSVTPPASIFINATASPAPHIAAEEFWAVDGWITQIDFLVRNDSGLTSSSQDIGLFQFEGTLF